MTWGLWCNKQREAAAKQAVATALGWLLSFASRLSSDGSRCNAVVWLIPLSDRKGRSPAAEPTSAPRPYVELHIRPTTSLPPFDQPHLQMRGIA